MSDQPVKFAARLFAELWSFFVDGGSIDGFALEQMIERTGLVEWREATEADVTASSLELEVGDPLLCLTDEGRRVLDEGWRLRRKDGVSKAFRLESWIIGRRTFRDR